MGREPEAVAERRRALGEQLAARRAGKRLRQSDVARATSLDRSTVAHIERGRAPANEQFWQRVDDLLQADGVLFSAYQELEAAKYAHEVRRQEQRLATLKAQPISMPELPKAFAPDENGDEQAPTFDDHTLRRTSTGTGANGPSAPSEPVMAPATAPRRVGNLPAEVTSFVGRRGEITQIKDALSATRLVTLTGVGGVGKSRLALQVADQVRRAFADGVWLVDLAPLQDAALVPHTLLDTLGIREQSRGGPTALLSEYLRDRRVLLVLDNCEHLLDSVAELMRTLQQAAPELHAVITSREPLGIAGEHRWAVSPLPVPEPEETLPSGAADRFAALALFAERAATISPGFAITARNQAAVTRLCHRLEGIPLAIELAAARLPTLSVAQIAQRLDDRFHLLTGRGRGALPRHQTLWAAVHWSFELCTPAEQVLWARMSVFAGGFDLEAAETVCAGDDIATQDVLDLVSGLVDKSVLICEEHSGHTRYRLLDTIRQFGQQMLRETGDEAALRRKHRDYYQQLVRQARAGFFSPHELESINRVRRENGNLRVALDYCLTTSGEAHTGLAMAAGLTSFWVASGGLYEPRRWLQRALELNPEPTKTRAKALGKYSHIALRLADADAAPLLAECRALAQRLGDDRTLAYAAHWSGVAKWYQGDIADGFVLLEEALERSRASGDIPGTQKALAWMAWAAAAVDDPRAAAFAEEALSLAEAHEAEWARSWALAMVGLARWRGNDPQQAITLLREAIRIKWQFHDMSGITPCMEALAWAMGAHGQHEYAAALLGATHEAWRLSGMTTAEIGPFVACHEECEQQARQALGAREFETAHARGTELSFDEAITFALGENDETVPASPNCAETTAEPPSPLTERESRVAELIAEGMSNKEIANRLMIGQRTVEGYVERILTKLGFTSRAQVAAWIAKLPTS